MIKIKTALKKSKIGRIIYYLREFYRYPKMVKVISNVKATGKIAILLGTPTFNNLGDHLIAVAEKQFIKKNYKEYKIVEIPTQVFLRYRRKLVSLVKDDVPIFITGGGWMGSLWPEDEYRMQLMISTFANKNITIFPQTVYYNLEEESGRKILQDAIKVYDKCKNMKMLFRDQTSYEFAKKHFEGKYTKVYLYPDIALYYKCNDVLVNRKGIRLCLRGDREKDSNLNVIEWTKRFATNKKIPCYMTDTVQNRSIPIWLRQKKINQKIAEFNRSEVVITDRLHGMIFAAISNTKCIAFDNLTHKVSGVYNLWLKDNPNTILLDNSCDEKEFLSSLVSIMEESGPNELWKDGLRYSFIKMMKDIESEE